MEGQQRGPMVRIVSVSSIGWHLQKRRENGDAVSSKFERQEGGMNVLQSFELVERQSPKYVGVQSITFVEPEMLDEGGVELYLGELLVGRAPHDELGRIEAQSQLELLRRRAHD